MKLDLHVHSRYSDDGVLDPEEIVAIARQKGLNGIAITDHDTIRGGQEATKYQTSDFIVIVGAEIMTDEGEVTGLFLSREIVSRHLIDAITEIKAQGGLAVIPHPFDGLRRSACYLTDEHAGVIDAVEGFNSRCIFQRYNSQAVEFASRHNIPVVAGSDAHYPGEIGIAGITLYSDDIRQAILDGRTAIFGKHSPLINHVRTKVGKLLRKIR